MESSRKDSSDQRMLRLNCPFSNIIIITIIDKCCNHIHIRLRGLLPVENRKESRKLEDSVVSVCYISYIDVLLDFKCLIDL